MFLRALKSPVKVQTRSTTVLNNELLSVKKIVGYARFVIVQNNSHSFLFSFYNSTLFLQKDK